MAAINSGTDLTIEGNIAIVTLDFPPVNAMSPVLMDGLYDALMAALADDAVSAVVLICAGRTFIAGADLKSIGKVEPKVDFFGLQDAIENAAKPTIAALHGTPLGGGLETAMTLHYRIAAPATRMGLPEVTLGLLPGGGGTQRMTRITGAQAALDLLMTGRQIPASEALAIGLIDRISASEETLRNEAIAFAREIVSEGLVPCRIRDREDKVAADRADPQLMQRLAVTWTPRMKGLDAPQAIFRCVAAAVEGPWEKGLAVERSEFAPLLHGPQSAALRHVFMAERAAAKVPGLDRDTPVRTITKVTVIGGGTMGSGIATTFLDAGFAVTLVETDGVVLDKGIARVRENFASQVKRGKLSQDKADSRLSALLGSIDLEHAVSHADLVVEAVFEDLDVKSALFKRLGAAARRDAILATNTSFLDVDAIAAATSGPERVVGLHFFSPAHIMRLLEIVRGAQTADDVLATSLAIAKKLGKVAVVSGVCHGFIGNRMLAVRHAQANALVRQGVSPWEIDRALVNFGFPMGPFAMHDLAGLDIAVSTNDPVCAALVAAGRKGQKTGAGYYDYSSGRQPVPDAATLAIIEAATGVKPGSMVMDDAAIFARLIFPMINEGAAILEQGIAQRASDIDAVWVTGYGWPAHTGGPMFHADRIGLPAVASALRAMPDVTLSPLLEKLADEGGTFTG